SRERSVDFDPGGTGAAGAADGAGGAGCAIASSLSASFPAARAPFMASAAPSMSATGPVWMTPLRIPRWPTIDGVTAVPLSFMRSRPIGHERFRVSHLSQRAHEACAFCLQDFQLRGTRAAQALVRQGVIEPGDAIFEIRDREPRAGPHHGGLR